MRAHEIRELRAVPALRLLTIWRRTREETEDPLERGLLCNAQVLAESCMSEEGTPYFPDREAVLEKLSTREMERLLSRLAGEASPVQERNHAFDPKRFQELEGS